jgi:hypothetical protein
MTLELEIAGQEREQIVTCAGHLAEIEASLDRLLDTSDEPFPAGPSAPGDDIAGLLEHLKDKQRAGRSFSERATMSRAELLYLVPAIEMTLSHLEAMPTLRSPRSRLRALTAARDAIHRHRESIDQLLDRCRPAVATSSAALSSRPPQRAARKRRPRTGPRPGSRPQGY